MHLSTMQACRHNLVISDFKEINNILYTVHCTLYKLSTRTVQLQVDMGRILVKGQTQSHPTTTIYSSDSLKTYKG